MSTQNGNTQTGPARPAVLVGIDFSSLSTDALRSAADLCRKDRGELHVVHVMPIPPGDPISASPPNMGLAFANRADEIRASLEQLVNPELAGIERVVLHVRVGTPDREIVQLANDIRADLIMVGTHGRTGLDRLVLGSVAESVVRRAPCPVYAYRPKAVAAWEQIEPPCPDCVAVQDKTGRSQLWCERHSQHHIKAHTHYQIPSSYGVGAQTFRALS